MTHWQPIASAPRDGTRILGFDPEGINGPVMAVIYWWKHESYSFQEVGDEMFRRVKNDDIEWWEGAGYTPFRATHWMPLPLPPDNVKHVSKPRPGTKG